MIDNPHPSPLPEGEGVLYAPTVSTHFTATLPEGVYGGTF